MSESANRENDQPPRYVYDALEPGQIRLLHVVSCSDVRAECELRHVELDSDEEWYALSYVWGNADPDCEVLLNGKILPIRRNLLAALKALEYLQGENERPYWIWIDALCLNQDDNVEKSEQVLKMSEIYRQALVVVIWLGDEQDCPQIVVEAFHFLWAHSRVVAARRQNAEKETTGSIVHDERQITEVEEIHWSNKYRMALYELESQFGMSRDQMIALYHFRLGLLDSCAGDPNRLTREATKTLLETSRYKEYFLPPAHPFWKSLIAFVEHEWHRRVWTMQESLLARDAVLLTSRGVIDWKFVIGFLKLFVLRPPAIEIISTDYFLATEDRARPIYEIRGAFDVADLYGGRPVKPGRLLRQIGLRKASLPKDYLYGLLGLLDAESRSSIKVYYSASDARVFVDAMRAAISLEPEMPWLGILWNQYERTPKTFDGLPSWCPDFSGSGRALLEEGINRFDLNSSIRKKYMHMAQVDLRCNEWTLGFAGVRLEKVLRRASTSFCRPWKHFTGDVEDHFHVCHNVEFHAYLHCLQSTFCTASGNFGPEAESFLRSLFPDGEASEAMQVQDFERLIWFCDEVRGRSIRSPLSAARMLNLEIEDTNRLIRCISLFALYANRFFFETDSGKMGFSWSQPSPGDNIIYAPGGRCLFMVSKDFSRYVGTTYVRGFEGDSLLTILPELDAKWEMFYVS